MVERLVANEKVEGSNPFARSKIMEDLSKKKCVACDGSIPPFDKSEIHKYLKKVDDWDVKSNDEKSLRQSRKVCLSLHSFEFRKVCISEKLLHFFMIFMISGLFDRSKKFGCLSLCCKNNPFLLPYCQAS